MAAAGGSEGQRESCCICSEQLMLGQRVRRLRCGHFLHVVCGDPYLTTQQAVCPVDGVAVNPDGNTAASMPATTEARTGRRPQRQRRDRRLGDERAASLPPALQLSFVKWQCAGVLPLLGLGILSLF